MKNEGNQQTEIERLWDSPQEEWGLDHWRTYARWLESEAKAARARNQQLRALEPTFEYLAGILDQDPSAGGLGGHRYEPRRVDDAQDFLRISLSKPLWREAFLRLRWARDPAVAAEARSRELRKGEIALRLWYESWGKSIRPAKRLGRPEVQTSGGVLAQRFDERRRAGEGPGMSLRRWIRWLVESSEHWKWKRRGVREKVIARLYQQALDWRKKVGKKSG